MFNYNVKNSRKKGFEFKILIVLAVIILYLALLIYSNDLNYVQVEPVQISPKEEITDLYLEYRLDNLSYELYNQMSDEERIGQLFMVSLPYNYIDDKTDSIISTYHVGGIVIMSDNISSQEQISEFTSRLQKISNTPLLIATDQEGGLVARIPWDNAQSISQPHIGIVNREDFAYETGENHAAALKQYNINLNLAPVLDVASVSGSSMSSRSFGSSVEIVINLGLQMIEAHLDKGVMVAPKHFPGIGRTTTDSHLELPVIKTSKEHFVSEEIVPFRESINSGVDVIMVGHALYPDIDKKYPASLSKTIIQDYLRGLLEFEGIVLTDDINMNALDDYPDRSLQAFKAGNDMILIVGTYENQLEIIKEVSNAYNQGGLNKEELKEKVLNILKVKIKNDVI